MAQNRDDEVGLVRRNGRPVAVRKVREQGWTAKRRKLFLARLAATANATAAARAAGLSASAAYQLRRRDPAFAGDWADAMAAAREALEALVIATALGTSESSDPCTQAAGVDAGDRPAPALPDARLALEYLSRMAGREGRPGRNPGRAVATKAELTAELLARIDKVRARQARLMGDVAPMKRIGHRDEAKR